MDAILRWLTDASDHRLASVCSELVATYGLPRHGNPKDPLADLVYVLLSNRSTASLAAQVRRRLLRHFTRWEDLVTAPIADVRAILRPLGLHWTRSRQLRRLLRRINARFGSYSLDALRTMNDADALAFLESLPGVSTKVAKCVQMYGLGAEVLPVDVHVYRISKRLGLISKTRASLSHDALEGAVPPPLRYTFHVTCVAHGREICRAKPLCDSCCIRSQCPQHGVER